MKLNQFFTALVITALTTGPMARAEVKPDGAILETYCGANEAAATERNRTITEVCLATVQGSAVRLVVIKSEDSRGRTLRAQTLPVVASKSTRLVSSASRTDILTLASSESFQDNGYTMLKTATVFLTVDTGRRPTLTPEMPKTLTGEDINGTPFEVNDLQPVMHTESVDIH